jgi:hypothetical protein
LPLPAEVVFEDNASVAVVEDDASIAVVEDVVRVDDAGKSAAL